MSHEIRYDTPEGELFLYPRSNLDDSTLCGLLFYFHRICVLHPGPHPIVAPEVTDFWERSRTLGELGLVAPFRTALYKNKKAADQWWSGSLDIKTMVDFAVRAGLLQAACSMDMLPLTTSREAEAELFSLYSALMSEPTLMKERKSIEAQRGVPLSIQRFDLQLTRSHVRSQVELMRVLRAHAAEVGAIKELTFGLMHALSTCVAQDASRIVNDAQRRLQDTIQTYRVGPSRLHVSVSVASGIGWQALLAATAQETLEEALTSLAGAGTGTENAVSLCAWCSE